MADDGSMFEPTSLWPVDNWWKEGKVNLWNQAVYVYKGIFIFMSYTTVSSQIHCNWFYWSFDISVILAFF